MSDAPLKVLRLSDLLDDRPGFRLQTRAGALAAHECTAIAIFGARASELAGKRILLATTTVAASARAMIALDGLVARLVIAPPDLDPVRIASIVEQASVDAIVSDSPDHNFGLDKPLYICGDTSPTAGGIDLAPGITQWVLPTSGTSGPPKLVVHHLQGLLGAITAGTEKPAPIWATFYDIRRFGGLQILLRACATGVHLALTEADESLSDYLERCARAGVSHLSGTPSHWRRLLLHPDAAKLDPKYIRLSGEIADASVLKALRAAYPAARIVHAYASTEAGVCFEVDDEGEGFPVNFLERSAPVEMKIVDGSLRVRSPRTAMHYIGREDLRLRDQEDFVDTDDIVEIRGDRCFFKGRRTGVINVGGLKVHPEEVEQVLNAHPAVRLARVGARRNPVIGDIVEAEVVLKDPAAKQDLAALRDDILSLCRTRLARHMTPATIRFVPSLEVLASGKLARRHA